MKVPAIATRASERPQNSVHEEFLSDYERGRLINIVRINQEMMKSIGIIRYNDQVKTLLFAVPISLCECRFVKGSLPYNI